MECDVKLVLLVYLMKLNISTVTITTVTKIVAKTSYCEFKRFLQCNKKNTGQNSVSQAL